VCPIGGLAFDRVRAGFDVDDDHVLLHSMLGGAQAPSRRAGASRKHTASPAAAAPSEAPSEALTAEQLIDSVRAFARQTLPEYLVPSRLVVLDRLPLSPNGKVDHAMLPPPPPRRGEGAETPPRTDAEKAVASMWMELLRLPAVDVRDDFFVLGGDSIVAVRFLNRVRQQFHVELPLGEFLGVAERREGGATRRANARRARQPARRRRRAARPGGRARRCGRRAGESGRGPPGRRAPGRDTVSDRPSVTAPSNPRPVGLSAEQRALLGRLLRGGLSASQAERLDDLGFAALPALRHDPEGRFDPFPLTEMQQAYWVGRQRSVELGNVAIHSYLELEVPALDVGRLEVAWNRVVGRHDMLRAVIRADGRQRVLRDVEYYRIPVDTCPSAEDQVAARLRQRERMSHRVYETDRWPLFALAVTRGPDGASVLHVSVDGVLLDAWSLSIVFRECLDLYGSPERRLPELTITFRDYVLAEARLRERPDYRASLEWWRERLETLPGPPDLPLLKQPRMLRAPRFVRRSGALEAGRWQRLRRAAGADGLTPPCLLLAVYAHVLSAWAASPTFTLTVPRFDRSALHPQVDDVVGEFASFTLLTCDLSRRATVLERGREIQRQVWELLEHGRVSGLEVTRQLMRRHGRGAASFPVVFTANPSLGALRPPEVPTSLGGRVAYAITQTPQVWLDFQVGEQDGRVSFNWDAVDELFPPGMVDTMNADFGRLLDTLAQDTARLALPFA
jgi:hypothetical protein